MALTPSTMLPLGTIAPEFELLDVVSNKSIKLQEIAKDMRATVVMFICNHCPYVIHVNDELIRVANDYMNKGVAFIAISSNDDVKYPQDGSEMMKENADKLGYPFPYLFDKDQEVARAYDAACTPDLYLFDQNLALVYRGRLDESKPNNGVPLTGKDLRNALDSVLSGNPVPEIQYPSMGCNIKWKS
jgi:peroxiredoxin